MLLCSMITFTFAQGNDTYPKLIKNAEGTFVTFTINQANHINNIYDLNLYMDSIISQLDSKDSIYLSIIDTSNVMIAKFKVIIDTQNAKIKNYNEIIDNFNLILEGYRKENNLLMNKNTSLNKQIKKTKLYLYTSIGLNIILVSLLVIK